jgi:hypothetical protein
MECGLPDFPSELAENGFRIGPDCMAAADRSGRGFSAEPYGGTNSAMQKRTLSSMIPVLPGICAEGRATVRWWSLYKDRTGSWPWASVAIHFMNWLVIVFGMGFLVWWTGEHNLSRWQFLGILLLVSIPYVVVENRIKTAVKLNVLRKRKGVAKI